MSEPGWPADGSCPGRSGETAPLLALEQVAYTASATVDYYGIYLEEAIDTAVAKVRTVLKPEG